MSNRYVIGVDLGGSRVRAVLANEKGEFLDRCEFPTLADKGLYFVLERILECVRSVSSNAPRIDAIGVGAPGPINSKEGVVSNPPNLPGWVNVPLAKLIEEKTGIPTFLGNDANLAALGEFTYGSGKYVQHLIYITVSTGVGGGIIIDGQLLEGHNGAAGEVGHMVVQPGGPKCSCGGYGHLEALSSGTAIAKRAREAASLNKDTVMIELAGSVDKINAKIVDEAAKKGDPLALKLLEQAGQWLGYALINLIHIFNPQMISIGGGVSEAGELLLGPARKVVFEGLMPVFKQDLQIVKASLGGDVGLAGAVALALQESAKSKV